MKVFINFIKLGTVFLQIKQRIIIQTFIHLLCYFKTWRIFAIFAIIYDAYIYTSNKLILCNMSWIILALSVCHSDQNSIAHSSVNF